jgi:hypothetical protein
MRKRCLTKEKLDQILALLKLGCSQNMAADFVGCSPSTIRREAERNPEFAAKLDNAQSKAELGWLQNIRKAAQKEQYWRAAAWALERIFPERYAPRGPDVLTLEQIGQMTAKFSQIIIEEIPERYRTKILNRLDALARDLGADLKRNDSHEST